MYTFVQLGYRLSFINLYFECNLFAKKETKHTVNKENYWLDWWHLSGYSFSLIIIIMKFLGYDYVMLWESDIVTPQISLISSNIVNMMSSSLQAVRVAWLLRLKTHWCTINYRILMTANEPVVSSKAKADYIFAYICWTFEMGQPLVDC